MIGRGFFRIFSILEFCLFPIPGASKKNMEDVFGVEYSIFRRKSQKSRKTAPIETAPKWQQKIYAGLVVGKIQIQSFFFRRYHEK